MVLLFCANMSGSERPLVVGAGRVSLEFLGVVPRLPEHDAPVELEEISVQVGGTAAIAVATAAALGCRTRLACKLADDFLGSFILSALRQAGVETRGTLGRESRLSRMGFTVAPRQFTRRLSFFTEGDVGSLTSGEIDVESLIEGSSALLVDGCDPTAQVALAEAARRRSVPVVFDGSQLQEGVGTLVALADVLICSERLASELAPRDELEEMLLEIQNLGPRAVIITMGPAGSVGIHGHQVVRQPSFDVPVVDASGAGSVYHGAFAAALLHELPFAHCMEFASAAAALSCRRLGGWAGIPEREEVITAVKKNRTSL
jgi:sugar/nucleoside kinase (ribokinase family)